MFKTRQIQTMENQDNRQQEIDKEPDSTNSEDFLEYFDLSRTCSIKRSLKIYQSNKNGITKST